MTQTLTRIDTIESKIDRQLAGGINVNTRKGLVVQSLGEAMELAKLMSVSDTAVPKHLRGNPGACLAIAIQGFEWSINPFALANKSYVVNDRIAYESALYHAVVQRRAPIAGRIKCAYQGKELTRTCRVWAALTGGDDTVEYTTPELGRIPTKNSPLWKGDPDQQLFYYAVRAFARRHFPDVMMGIYTVDEVMDEAYDNMKVSQAEANGQSQSRTSAVLAKLAPPSTSRPVSKGQTLELNGDAVNTDTGELREDSADAATAPDVSGEMDPPSPEELQPNADAQADDQQPAPTDDPLTLFRKQCEAVLSTSADIDDFDRAFGVAVTLAKKDKSGVPVEADRAKIVEQAKTGTGPFARKQ